ncbi:hypothetical protein P8452_61111 [Trifolium repens]|nr:hypothetical protein P8452_61111 [Trifolium repens]
MREIKSATFQLLQVSPVEWLKFVEDVVHNGFHAVAVKMLQLVRVGAFLFLLSSESLLMGVTKCMCLERPLTPGGNRAWYTIYFLSSW